MQNLQRLSNNLVHINSVLFKSKKYLKDFLKNKKIERNFYWENILHYPKFDKKTFTRNDLLDHTILVIKNENNNFRGIHPVLPIMFHKELEKIGIYFKLIPSNDTLELLSRNSDIKVRKQISETIKIFDILLNDNDLFEFIGRDCNSLILNSPIEWKVNTYPSYCKLDWCIKFNKNVELWLEVNEDHHDPEKDNIRLNEIFVRNNRKLIMYYIEKDSFRDDVLPQVFEELSRQYMPINMPKAMKIYCGKIANMDLDMVEIFINLESIYKKLKSKNQKIALPLNDIVLRLSIYNWDKNKILSKFESLIEIGDLPKSELLNYNGDLTSSNVMITDKGIDYFFTSISLADWKGALDFKESYHIFRKGYFQMVEDIKTNATDNARIFSDYIDLHLTEMQNMSDLIKSEDKLIELLWKDNVTKMEEFLKFRLHPIIPWVKYEKGKKINIKRLQKEFPTRSKKWAFVEESKGIIKNYTFMTFNEKEACLQMFLDFLKKKEPDSDSIENILDIEEEEMELLSEEDDEISIKELKKKLDEYGIRDDEDKMGIEAELDLLKLNANK